MNREPLNAVTAEMVEAYRRDGAVHVPGVLDEGWVEHLRAAVALARTRPGPNAQDHSIEGESGGFFSDLQMSHRVPAFLPFITGSPMGAVAAELMGSRRVTCCTTRCGSRRREARAARPGITTSPSTAWKASRCA